MYHEAALMRALVRFLVLIAVSLSAVPGVIAAQAVSDGRLDVNILVFDPGIPADASTHGELGIFPEIRKSETRYMPVLLREVLMESGDWGVVRVVPRELSSSELQLNGSILHSDGLRLQLHITARDATGALWLDADYSGTTTSADYPVALSGDPYLDVYRQIARDLLAARKHRTSAQLEAVREIALIRYAQELVPDAFSAYLAGTEEEGYRLQRLPAADDPMLARVIRAREHEYRFIDTVDEQYLQLGEDIAHTYNLWRQFGSEQAIYREEFERRVSTQDRQGRAGSYAALQQTYNVYRQSKIQEQDLDELAKGFNNEVAPTHMEVSGTVFKLNGSLDAQYKEWRAILKRIFELETGLAPSS